MFKKSFYLFLAIPLFISSCNTKFSVNGEYEEKVVIHFLLDQGEEFHFMKLNKTFLKEGDATEFAKEPELSEFENVVATIEETGMGGAVLRKWTLSDTLIENKKEGMFYGPEQKLYYFRADDLNPDAIYKLSIDIDNGTHLIKGQTNLISGLKVNLPKAHNSFNFADNDVIANGYKSTSISISPGNAAKIKAQLRFDYKEFRAGEETEKSLFWNLGENDKSEIADPFIAKGKQFYEFLQNSISENSDVDKRVFTGFEIILTAASDDLVTYVLANMPTSSLAQNKPVYSNIEGALGIFSSRQTFRQYMPSLTPISNYRSLNKNSTKELCNGTYTSPLKFCSDIPEDANSNYFCN